MKIGKAALSGVLAASAGVFGKYGFQDSQDLWYYKVLSVLIMLGLNSLMINFVVKSFKEMGAAKTTVINLAFNYTFSALLAYLVFSEEISQSWIIGAVLMFIGVYIVNSDN